MSSPRVYSPISGVCDEVVRYFESSFNEVSRPRAFIYINTQGQLSGDGAALLKGHIRAACKNRIIQLQQYRDREH